MLSKARILILAVCLLLIPTISYSQQFVSMLIGVTAPTSSTEVSISSGSRRTYWVYITGTASLSIFMSPTSTQSFVPFVTAITTSGFIDTTAPGTRTRVDVVSCTGCTVTVLLEVR